MSVKVLQSFGKAMTWTLLWLLVPFLFIFWAMELVLKEDVHERQRREIELFEEYGRRFPGIAPIEKLLYAGMAPLEEASALADADGQRLFSERAGKLKRLFPGVFEFAYFDSDSRLIASLSDLPEFHPELERYGRLTREKYEGDSPVADEVKRLRVTLFGPLAWKYPTHRKMLCGFFGEKRAFVGFSVQGTHAPWFIVWISLPCDLETIAHRCLLAFYRPSDHGGRQGIIDLGEDFGAQARALWGTVSAPDGALEGVLAQLGNTYFKAVSHRGEFWLQIPVSARKRLLISVPNRSEENERRWRDEQRVSLMAAFLLLGGLIGGVGACVPPPSLRRKLLLLFVSAVLVPLCPFAFSIWRLQVEEGQVLEERELRNQEEIQREYFRRSFDALSLIEVCADRVFGPLLSPDPVIAGEQARKRVERFRSRFPIECTSVFDADGKSLFNHSRGQKDLFQRSIPFIGLKVARTIAEYCGREPASQIIAKEQALKASLETIGMDIDQLMAVFDQSPNQMAMAVMDETTSAFLRFHLFDVERCLRLIVFFIWGDSYLHDVLPYKTRDQFQRLLPEHALFVGGMISLGYGLPKGPLNPAIPGKYLTAKLGASWNLPRAMHQREVIDGKKWLLSFARGGLGNRLTSVLISSDARIQEMLRQKVGHMGLMAIPLLILGIFMGAWMGHSFLRRFQHLAEGMTAVDEHRFDHRVPVVGEDELAQLSRTFNLMMEGLEDLEVGKVVQATFFPCGSLESNGWSVFGSSRTAAKVGGDYVDYFPLPDGRWLILIGDATGHGVSAGLIVAMAKAVSHHPLALKTPAMILHHLNQVLAPTLKRRWMMTCFIGLFDPTTGTFEASNAGQNYPLLVRQAGATPIEINNLMLGAKSNQDYSTRSMTLADEDWICFYTDGLTEAPAREGKIIGPDRFREALPGLLRCSACETQQAILAWHEGSILEAVPQDDRTVVVLQKGRHPNSLARLC